MINGVSWLKCSKWIYSSLVIVLKKERYEKSMLANLLNEIGAKVQLRRNVELMRP